MKAVEKSKAHFIEAFRWSADPVGPTEIVASALAISVPVLACALAAALVLASNRIAAAILALTA